MPSPVDNCARKASDMRLPQSTKTARVVLLLFATAAVLGVMLSWVGPERLMEATRQLGWRGCLWLLLLYVASQLVRTWRIQLGFSRNERPSFLEIFAIANLHQFSNHLLPARLGEFAFPLLIHRRFGIAPERSLAILLRIRMQEVFVLAVLFLAALFRLPTITASSTAGTAHFLPLLVIGGATLFLPVFAENAFPRSARLMASCADRLAQRISYSRAANWVSCASDGLNRFASVAALPVSITQRFTTFVLTLLVWVFIYGLFHEAMRLSGNPVPLSSTIVGASFANLAQVLPVNTLGSIGSMEAGWTLGFSIVGVEPKIALATALVVHALVLAFLALFCIPSWLWLRRRRSQSTPSQLPKRSSPHESP